MHTLQHCVRLTLIARERSKVKGQWAICRGASELMSVRESCGVAGLSPSHAGLRERGEGRQRERERCENGREEKARERARERVRVMREGEKERGKDRET